MDKQIPHKARDYSKRFFGKDRNELAGKIRQMRKDRDSNNNDLQQQRELGAKIGREISEKGVEEEKSKEQLTAYQDTIRYKFFNFFKIPDNRFSQMTEQLQKLQELTSGLLDGQEAVTSYLAALEEEQPEYAEQARRMIDGFYQDVASKEQEDHDYDDVDHIMKQENVVVIHGFAAAGSHHVAGGDRTKLYNIIVNKRLNLCCSTLKSGDNYSNMFALSGVLINKGKVTGANNVDAGSVVKTDGERESIYFDNVRKTEEVKSAIEDRPQYDYNEFNIGTDGSETMGIYGYYICLDEIPDDKRKPYKEHPPVKEIVDAASSVGLPVYVIEGGDVYESQYDEATQVISKVGESISASQLSQHDSSLKLSNRKVIIDDFRNTFPFGDYSDKESISKNPGALQSMVPFLIERNNDLLFEGVEGVETFIDTTISDKNGGQKGPDSLFNLVFVFSLYDLKDKISNTGVSERHKKLLAEYIDSSGIGRDQYESFVSKHIDDDGLFSLTTAEVEQYLETGSFDLEI